jgi:hypothetical protein
MSVYNGDMDQHEELQPAERAKLINSRNFARATYIVFGLAHLFLCLPAINARGWPLTEDKKVRNHYLWVPCEHGLADGMPTPDQTVLSSAPPKS